MKRKLLLTTVALAVLGGSIAHTAQAHIINPIHKPLSKMTLKEQYRYYKANELHAEFTLQWFRSTQGNWTLDAKRYPAAYTVSQTVIRNHKWLLKDSRQHEREIEAKLHPVSVIKYSAGHFSGWSCITNGAYPGAPHEGDGYNGLYSGPLGMTTPWEGHYPPGRDWVHSSISAVYAIAEEVASSHGFNYGWMSGQWPRTFPPCAGYFR